MHNKVLRTGTACFIILLLLLTTTMGLAAVKQQQFNIGNTGTYFSIPFDISMVNPRNDTNSNDFVKLLLESAVCGSVVILTCFVVMQGRVYTPKAGVSRLPVWDKVVLLE